MAGIFDKNVERKKNTGRANSGTSIFNPTLQLVVVNLNTKFEVSILNGCGDIFDQKSGETEKRTNIGKDKSEKAHFLTHDATCGCEPVYQI